MQLTDVRIDRFGVLSNMAVDSLSGRVTVLYGPQGSGKSTFVKFLRGLLYGCRREATPASSGLLSESGSVHIETTVGPRVLRRSWSSVESDQFSVIDERDRYLAPRQDNHLPAWVTGDVFREIFSAGIEEADRFDLLIRLCLESTPVRSSHDEDIRQADLALQQAVRERDGNGIQGGVVHRISEMRRRQGELQGEIAALRKPAGDLPARIEQLNREISVSSGTIDRSDARICEIEAEIARLEVVLTELCRRNVLPLNRPRLDEDIRAITVRLDRWHQIRRMIAIETAALHPIGDASLRAEECMLAMRAIVSRLEERTQALTDRLQENGFTEPGRSRDGDNIRHLRGEIAALCQYFEHHERMTSGHVEALQSLFANRSLADVQQLERLLEEQLATQCAELSRADNVLAESAVPEDTDGCRFTGHQDSIVRNPVGTVAYHSVSEVESQIRKLRSERIRLDAERATGADSRNANRILLERLQSELAGTATLEQLDFLRARIAELDAEVSLLEDQRRQLDRTEFSLREVIERLKSRGVCRVFELASRFLQRMTEGEYHQISESVPDRLLIRAHHHNEPLTLAMLNREARDQVALALRLALIEVRTTAHGHVPLILDDVFVASDNARAGATVQLLTEIAQAGQQILFLTSRTDVRDQFARDNADVRVFAPRMEIPVPVMQPAVPVVLHAYVEPQVEVRPAFSEPVHVHHPVLPQPVIVEPTQMLAATNWLFYLEVDHGVEDLAGITLGELEALRSSGIVTIDDLLSRTVPQLEELTRKKGFTLSVDRLHALRGQAELTTRVPMLRRSDAALLFAAGVHSVEELSRLRPETVYDRVTEFQRSEAGGRFRRGGRLIDRQQAINWARFGQCSRSPEDARNSRSRFASRSSSKGLPSVSQRSPINSTEPSAAVTSVHRPPESDPQGLRRRRRRMGDDVDADQRRARRLARRRRQASRLRTEPAATGGDDDQAVERSGGMRFFLSRTSEIEKAPSIGPRTAQLLEAIGVRTVEEFLSMTSERLAEKLNHRRMTAHVIQQWQAQSRLMCQIPELRGHDAQILVACGITAPETLASQKATDLFSVVGPFSRSKDGERIIRNGRHPDLAEVTDWIQWAANARSMRAA